MSILSEPTLASVKKRPAKDRTDHRDQDEEISEKIFIPPAVMEIFEAFSKQYESYDYEHPARSKN